MKSSQKFFFGIGVISVFVIAGYIALNLFGKLDQVDEQSYTFSSEMLSPYEISKNPYKYKGKSGILDTVSVQMIGANSQGLKLRYPGGGLRFEKMIDEHTATYSILVAGSVVMSEGEIAVSLPDSNQPDPSRRWLVQVLGPKEAVNGLGQNITVSEVRFMGYYTEPASGTTNSSSEATSLPPNSVPQTPLVDSTETPSTASQDEANHDQEDDKSTSDSDSTGQHQSAPIVRQVPPPTPVPISAPPQW